MNALLLALLLCPTSVPKLVQLDEGCPAPITGVLYTPQYHKDTVDNFKKNKAELGVYRLRVPQLLEQHQKALERIGKSLARAEAKLEDAEDDSAELMRQNAKLSRRVDDAPSNRWSWAGLGAGGAIAGYLVPLVPGVRLTEIQEAAVVLVGAGIGVFVAWLYD